MSNISYILSPFSAETVENKRPEKRRRIDSHFAPTLDSQPIQASGHGAAQLVVDRNDGTCELASHEVESAERICFGMVRKISRLSNASELTHSDHCATCGFNRSNCFHRCFRISSGFGWPSALQQQIHGHWPIAFANCSLVGPVM